MPRPRTPLVGTVIANRLVLRDEGLYRGSRARRYRVRCLVCGREGTTARTALMHGVGCRCAQAPPRLSHGQSGRRPTRLYRAWQDMKARCRSATGNRAKYYVERGITVCARWRESFEAFAEDLGAPPTPQHTLGRLDHAQGYEPGNCAWQNWQQQHPKKVLQLSA